MTHIESFTDIDKTIRQMVEKIKSSKTGLSKLEMRIFGGDQSSTKILYGIAKATNEWRNEMEIVETDIQNLPKSIIIDSEDGKVYDIARKRQRIDYNEMQTKITGRNARAMFEGKISAEQVYK